MRGGIKTTNKPLHMSRFFHATRVDYVDSIQQEGLKPIWDYVYLTDSLESAVRWMGFRLKAIGDTHLAVVEVEVDAKNLEQGTDHSPLMNLIFGVGMSYISHKPIAKSRIKKIHYFDLTSNSPSQVSISE